MAATLSGIGNGCQHLGHRARRENRDPGFRADGAPRPDDDLASAREPHARVVAHHRAVHRDGLFAIAVFSYRGHAIRCSADEPAHPDPLRARATRVDGAPDRDCN